MPMQGHRYMKTGTYFCFALLTIGVILQFIPRRKFEKFPPHASLSSLLPRAVDGWDGADQLLGETELVTDRVKDILRYDDYVFRTYRRGDVEIGVFVAYWKPGNSDKIEVARHSPDHCWPQSGWTRVGEEDEVSYDAGGLKSEIGQLRHFRNQGMDQYTVFWQLMGGKRTGYAQGDQSRWSKRIPAVLKSWVGNNFGFDETEQYFIRITANRPLQEISREPIFTTILKDMAQFGLFSI
jgi:hypothetical protein